MKNGGLIVDLNWRKCYNVAVIFITNLFSHFLTQIKMKNKFLALALVTAMVAVFVMPSTFAATQGGTAEVDVTAGTFTLSIAGNVAAPTFALTAGEGGATNRDVKDAPIGTSDYIEVVDHTGNNVRGHKVQIAFNKNTWTYSGDGIGVVDPTVSTDASPGVDEISFATSATASKTTTAAVGCTPNAASYAFTGTSAVVLHGTPVTLALSSDDCPATYSYTPTYWEITSPSNGLSQGTYQITGTLTLTDVAS